MMKAPFYSLLFLTPFICSGNEKEPIQDNEKKIYMDAVKSSFEATSKAIGVSVEKVKATENFRYDFFKFIKVLKTKYPLQISTYWAESIPAIKGHVRFVGIRPNSIEELTRNHGFRLDEIEYYDHEELTWEQHAERSRVLFRMLQQEKTEICSSGYSVSENKIKLVFCIDNKTPLSTAEEIIDIWDQKIKHFKPSYGGRFEDLKIEDVAVEKGVRMSYGR